MISIIIPTYNDSSWMMPGLQSCLRQNVVLEIIIVDDRSTIPFVPEVLKFIEDHSDICTLVQTDKGPNEHNPAKNLANARNTGIRHSKYPYFLPLDADDYLFDNILPDMLGLIQDGDVVCGQLWIHSRSQPPLFSNKPMEQIIRLENPLFVSSLIRKDLWERVGGYPLFDGGYYEDWAFWHRCFKARARFRYLAKNVYHYTVRNGISSKPRDHNVYRQNTLKIG